LILASGLWAELLKSPASPACIKRKRKERMKKNLSTHHSEGTGLVKVLSKHNDVLLAAVIVAVISLMIFPLPPLALDILIGINIAASIALLMMSMYVSSALALSTFPALLLFTTLFRLSLNIASTKQILLHAHAGQIIETFGKLIVGGNVIVGIVVFIIIAIVQFIVIAKGSERVAEVGARFTLDAMPGKQMSIDADVRANLITAEEAKNRRNKLELESKLHGSLDGAMKCHCGHYHCRREYFGRYCHWHVDDGHDGR
jgi:type III secretion protein V